MTSISAVAASEWDVQVIQFLNEKAVLTQYFYFSRKSQRDVQFHKYSSDPLVECKVEVIIHCYESANGISYTLKSVETPKREGEMQQHDPEIPFCHSLLKQIKVGVPMPQDE